MGAFVYWLAWHWQHCSLPFKKTTPINQSKKGKIRRGFTLRQRGNCSPKPKPCFLPKCFGYSRQQYAVLKFKTYYTAFYGLQNTSKCVSGRGSAPDPAGRAYDALQTPSRMGRGIPPPHTPPHSALFAPRFSRLRRCASISGGADIFL